MREQRPQLSVQEQLERLGITVPSEDLVFLQRAYQRQQEFLQKHPVTMDVLPTYSFSSSKMLKRP